MSEVKLDGWQIKQLHAALFIDGVITQDDELTFETNTKNADVKWTYEDRDGVEIAGVLEADDDE